MITRRRMLSAPQAAPIRSAAAKSADLRDTETAAPHRPGCRFGWMTAGLLASTALAGGADAATGPGSVSINWDALDVIGGDTVGGDQAVSGLAADIARPVPPGDTGAAVFVPGTWPHSGTPNYGYMRLPRYYGGPVHTPFALTPYQPADRPVLGADLLAAARSFAATSAAVGVIVPDAPLRSTVDISDSFTSAVAPPATHPVNLARASTLRRTPGGGHVVQYDPAVFSPVLLADAGTAAGSPGIAATSSDSLAPLAGPVASFQPVQVAQLASSTRIQLPSMTDGAPGMAYDEGPYGQMVPRAPRHPALPQRSFTNLNATTIRARLHTRRMGPADFLQPAASPSYNAAGPRTRLTPPPRAVAPRQSYAPALHSYALPSRAPQTTVAPITAGDFFAAPVTALPYVGRFTSSLPPRGDRLEPPSRRPRSAANQPARGDAGGWPGVGIAVDAPTTRFSRDQLTSRIAPDLAFGAAVPPPRYRPAGRAAVPAQGPVIISSATVGSAEPVAASPRNRSRPVTPRRQAPAASVPAPSVPAAPINTAPVVPPSTTSLAPTTTPVAAPAAPQPKPKPSIPAVTQPRPVAPLPPAPSEPITTTAPPMPVVESPPVTGSSTISGTLSAPAARRVTPEPGTVPSPPPPVPAMAVPLSTIPATTVATIPSATTLSAALAEKPEDATVADPAPTPLPDARAAADPAVTTDAAAPPAPGTAASTQLATRPRATTATPGGVLATVAFQPGDPELSEQARTTLASMATSLAGDEGARIQLNAYAAAAADNPASARRLSLTRALAVRKYLIEQGIRSIRMDVRARGSDVADGSPERVDILLKTQ